MIEGRQTLNVASSDVTHAALVKVAERWLRKTRGCGVVLTEHGGGRELPDAIGWKGGFSHLVECKISRSDFLADRLKPSRASYAVRPAYMCYYLTPFDLLFGRAADRTTRVLFRELPEGWGLLEVGPTGRVALTIRPKDVGYDDRGNRDVGALRDEVYRLYCEVRRYQIHGMKYPPLSKTRERLKALRRERKGVRHDLQLVTASCACDGRIEP